MGKSGAAGEREAVKIIAAEPLVRPDYVELVSGEDRVPLMRVEGKFLLAMAAYVGKTRLIDNLMGEVDGGSFVVK